MYDSASTLTLDRLNGKLNSDGALEGGLPLDTTRTRASVLSEDEREVVESIGTIARHIPSPVTSGAVFSCSGDLVCFGAGMHALDYTLIVSLLTHHSSYALHIAKLSSSVQTHSKSPTSLNQQQPVHIRSYADYIITQFVDRRDRVSSPSLAYWGTHGAGTTTDRKGQGDVDGGYGGIGKRQALYTNQHSQSTLNTGKIISLYVLYPFIYPRLLCLYTCRCGLILGRG